LNLLVRYDQQMPTPGEADAGPARVPILLCPADRADQWPSAGNLAFSCLVMTTDCWGEQ